MVVDLTGGRRQAGRGETVCGGIDGGKKTLNESSPLSRRHPKSRPHLPIRKLIMLTKFKKVSGYTYNLAM
jgi:hypothetical protein